MIGRRRVAVLGAGIMGTCTALYLARRGCEVVLFDEAPAPFSGASRWNEGKIHLGYLYAAAPSLDTAEVMVPGGLLFKPLIEDLVGASLEVATTSEDDIYLVHRDSVVDRHVVHAYFETVAALVRSHPDARHYLTDARTSPVRPLTRGELDEHADGAVITAGFRVRERSVSTTWVADRLTAALTDSPRVALRMRERVLDTRPEPGGHDRWEVLTGTATHQGFDFVVNALWHGRPSIDARVGDCLDRQALHRYRVALFIRTRRPLSVPSALVCVGPYGDVKNYNGRDFYVSWYPVGMLVSGDGPAHPPAPVLDANQQVTAASAMFDALGAILPGVTGIREAAEHVDVAGGWVYAQARGTLEDPQSTLHRRDHLGVKWFGRYVSVDTGKYSVAPYLARTIADRIVAS